MITRPTNWSEVREFPDRPKLPLGAYVCKVKMAVIQQTEYGNQLCLLFDIVEGEYKGFYDNDFKANTSNDKKWKGVLRYWLPKDDGSENDEWTKSSLKGMVTAFEKSNPGYTWNWDENTLVGKMIGVLFRNEEWDYKGKTGWAVRPFRAISIDTVRDGSFTLPKDKLLKNKTTSYGDNTFGGISYGYNGQPSGGFAEINEDGDLPF